MHPIETFELQINTLRGTRKLSQNKPEEEVSGLLNGIGVYGAHAMSAAMRKVRV